MSCLEVEDRYVLREVSHLPSPQPSTAKGACQALIYDTTLHLGPIHPSKHAGLRSARLLIERNGFLKVCKPRNFMIRGCTAAVAKHKLEALRSIDIENMSELLSVCLLPTYYLRKPDIYTVRQTHRNVKRIGSLKSCLVYNVSILQYLVHDLRRSARHHRRRWQEKKSNRTESQKFIRAY